MADTSKDTSKNETVAERFTNIVMKQFTSNLGEFKTTEAQRGIIQGYFMGCNNALATAEAKRIKDGKKDQASFTWNNVVIDEILAQKIVVYSKIGLDMNIPNHLSAIPRWNSNYEKYTLAFQEGYTGYEIKVRKYAYDVIEDIAKDLIHANDKFTVHKKDSAHEYDSYEFEITNPFDRGAVVGGFCYIAYGNKTKNTLTYMNMEQINKRKACATSKVFWDKWPDEMALKTVIINGCKGVLIDPKKIDDNYRALVSYENEGAELELTEAVNNHDNGPVIDIIPEEPKKEEPKKIEQQPSMPQVQGVSIAQGEAVAVGVKEPKLDF